MLEVGKGAEVGELCQENRPRGRKADPPDPDFMHDLYESS